MSNTESNRAAAWLGLSAILFLIGIRLVGSVLFDPYGTAGAGQVMVGLFLISASWILPFKKIPRKSTQK